MRRQFFLCNGEFFFVPPKCFTVHFLFGPPDFNASTAATQTRCKNCEKEATVADTVEVVFNSAIHMWPFPMGFAHMALVNKRRTHPRKKQRSRRNVESAIGLWHTATLKKNVPTRPWKQKKVDAMWNPQLFVTLLFCAGLILRPLSLQQGAPTCTVKDILVRNKAPRQSGQNRERAPIETDRIRRETPRSDTDVQGK